MTTWRRLTETIERDDGVALITVLGIMLVITVLALGSYSIASQALHEATTSEDESRAFRVASAGVDSVVSSFNPTVTSYPPIVTPDGTATVTVTATGGDAGAYEIVSDGVGIDGRTERVVQQFFYFNLWEMNFAGTGSQSLMSGSSGMNGSSNIYGPFYIKGNLAVEANMTVADGPLFVKGGKLTTTSGASQIGTATKPVRVYCDGTTDLTKGTIYVQGPFYSVPTIELPKITQADMAAYATLAQAESKDGRMSRKTDAASAPVNLELTTWGGSAYKYFGGASISSLGAGTTTLTLGNSSFGSWGAHDTTGTVVAAGGPTTYDNSLRNVHEDFAYWNEYTSDWDVLFISGTVFVDGPLVMDDNIMYIGNGTIVANGPVTLNGKVRPFSYSTADVTVNKVGEDKKWALGIVTPVNIVMRGRGSNDGTQPIRDNAFDYAGAFYTDAALLVPQPNTSLRGSILSNKMEFSSPNTDLVTNPLLPSYLPDSLPGGGEGILSMGLWSRG